MCCSQLFSESLGVFINSIDSSLSELLPITVFSTHHSLLVPSLDFYISHRLCPPAEFLLILQSQLKCHLLMMKFPPLSWANLELPTQPLFHSHCVFVTSPTVICLCPSPVVVDVTKPRLSDIHSPSLWDPHFVWGSSVLIYVSLFPSLSCQ